MYIAALIMASCLGGKNFECNQMLSDKHCSPELNNCNLTDEFEVYQIRRVCHELIRRLFCVPHCSEKHCIGLRGRVIKRAMDIIQNAFVTEVELLAIRDKKNEQKRRGVKETQENKKGGKKDEVKGKVLKNSKKQKKKVKEKVKETNEVLKETKGPKKSNEEEEKVLKESEELKKSDEEDEKVLKKEEETVSTESKEPKKAQCKDSSEKLVVLENKKEKVVESTEKPEEIHKGKEVDSTGKPEAIDEFHWETRGG